MILTATIHVGWMLKVELAHYFGIPMILLRQLYSCPKHVGLNVKSGTSALFKAQMVVQADHNYCICIVLAAMYLGLLSSVHCRYDLESSLN